MSVFVFPNGWLVRCMCVLVGAAQLTVVWSYDDMLWSFCLVAVRLLAKHQQKRRRRFGLSMLDVQALLLSHVRKHVDNRDKKTHTME